MRETTQRGSIVSFVLVATALLLLTAGAIFWAKQSGQDAARDVGVTTPGDDITIDGATQDADSKAKNDNTPTTNDQAATTDNDAAKDETSTQSSTRDSQTGSTAETSVTAYSQTGPADTLLQITGLGALSMSVLMYRSSRRAGQL